MSRYRFWTREIPHMFDKRNGDRFEYFVQKISDFGEVWSPKTPAGWVLLGDEGGTQVAPFWPFREFAEQCAIAEWSDASPELIDLKSFTEKWLPGLNRDRRFIAVFPNKKGESLVVGPSDLLERIEEERDSFFDN